MSKRFTLEELCRDDRPKIPDKDYPFYEHTMTSEVEPAVIRVSLKLLADALKGDSIWASSMDERCSETFMLARYGRAVKTLQDGKPIFRPWLSFREGRVRVTDGRHRLYALIEEGYTHVEVVCNENLRTIIETLK